MRKSEPSVVVKLYFVFLLIIVIVGLIVYNKYSDGSVSSGLSDSVRNLFE